MVCAYHHSFSFTSVLSYKYRKTVLFWDFSFYEACHFTAADNFITLNRRTIYALIRKAFLKYIAWRPNRNLFKTFPAFSNISQNLKSESCLFISFTVFRYFNQSRCKTNVDALGKNVFALTGKCEGEWLSFVFEAV